MLKGVLDYIPTRRKARLFQQWVDNAKLPEEEVPLDLRKERPQEEDLTISTIRQEKVIKTGILINYRVSGGITGKIAGQLFLK